MAPMCAVLFLSFLQLVASQAAPEVTIKNGTIRGVSSAEWKQDWFLGIPFAQPPVGDLRFRWPQSINTSFDGVLDASKYGYSCYQYTNNSSMSEDCLTLNVIRPAGYEDQTLPVLVWIYGGGLYAGSIADPQYNLTALVHTSTLTPTPFIAVSMNYRLGIWGFLSTPLIHAEGSSNAGLLDQRLALHWIQENIASFGGDPTRVTIWGESAGAQSIGLHLHSYSGRNDNLFHGAILESGGPQGAPWLPMPFYQSAIQNITRTLSCPQTWTSPSQLSCLRSLTSAQLFAANYSVTFNPIIDGDFLTDYPSSLRARGEFIKVPIITGANTDEGISFNPAPANSTEELARALLYYRNNGLSPGSIRRLLELYPDDNAVSPPYADTSNATYPGRALQYRRAAAVGGDIVMIAQRRVTAEQFANAGMKVWSFRFDTSPVSQRVKGAVAHFDNVAFSFQNVSGLLGAGPASHAAISQGIGKIYANFVGTGDPNGGGGDLGDTLVWRGDAGSGSAAALKNRREERSWPQWTQTSPVNIVLNATGSFIEDDTFRQEGIAFINSIWREFYA